MKSSIKMQRNTLNTLTNKDYRPLNQSYIERDKLYKTKRWRMIRRKHLERHPVCVKCGATANTVDHKDGHDLKTWRDTFFTSELIAYCTACHSRKTVLEDMKNKTKRLTNAEKLKLLGRVK